MFLGLCSLDLPKVLPQKCSAWKMNFVLPVSLVWAQSFASVCFTAGLPQKNTPTRMFPTSACSTPHNTLRCCEEMGFPRIAWTQSFARVCLTSEFSWEKAPMQVFPTSACSKTHDQLPFLILNIIQFIPWAYGFARVCLNAELPQKKDSLSRFSHLKYLPGSILNALKGGGLRNGCIRKVDQ